MEKEVFYRKRWFITTAFVAFDIIALLVSAYIGYILSGGKSITEFFSTHGIILAVNVGFYLLTFVGLKMYNFMPGSVGLQYVLKIVTSFAILTVLNFVAAYIFKNIGFRWSVCYLMFFAMLVLFSRFSYRTIKYAKFRFGSFRDKEKKRVIVVGGGDAGNMLIREMLTSDKIDFYPVCIIDDDPAKKGMQICGVWVVGNTTEIKKYADKYKADCIIVAMPSVAAAAKKAVFARCAATGIKVMTVPGLYQFVNDQLSVTQLRNVEIKDLLGRDQVCVNLDEIMGYIENKTVLVTGGSGSIGSELCRQIASHRPARLIIFDIYENTTYALELELRKKYPKLDLLALIGSVRDSRKMDALFEKYRPQIVFHAAAHKHVPLMETSPNEAVKNNVMGTLKTARAADKYGAERFVLISTDKAVNPTNVMGATKRICEMIIQNFAKKSKTNFVAVRFGNVLGSNGSVIPIFEKQIKEGGPVTVTHKDITRYFMTIPEAVSLVLQAGAYAKGGEIFVLDMGEPVKINDLAVNMIKLSGYEPDVDIKIEYTGLRPGEKLYEERLMSEEGMQKTDNQLISIAHPIQFDNEKLERGLEFLYDEAYAETDKMKEFVHDLVPSYKIDNRE